MMEFDKDSFYSALLSEGDARQVFDARAASAPFSYLLAQHVVSEEEFTSFVLDAYADKPAHFLGSYAVASYTMRAVDELPEEYVSYEAKCAASFATVNAVGLTKEVFFDSGIDPDDMTANYCGWAFACYLECHESA